jgi:hypothetical protein
LSKKLPKSDTQYQFVKDYKTEIVVGGVVGTTEKVYHEGDFVLGEETAGGLKVRIAPHSDINSGRSSPNSYQEFLVIPFDYLTKTDFQKFTI